MRDLQQEANRLLSEAMKQPGVAEVAELYKMQKPSIDAFNIAQQVIAPKWHAVSSSSSSTSGK